VLVFLSLRLCALFQACRIFVYVRTCVCERAWERECVFVFKLCVFELDREGGSEEDGWGWGATE